MSAPDTSAAALAANTGSTSFVTMLSARGINQSYVSSACAEATMTGLLAAAHRGSVSTTAADGTTPAAKIVLLPTKSTSELRMANGVEINCCLGANASPSIDTSSQQLPPSNAAFAAAPSPPNWNV